MEEDELYALLVSELCLLRYRNGEMAFPHQVFRDYCAAEYLNQLLDDVSVIPEEWKSTQISMAVAGYLRNMRQDVWAQDGLCHQMLDSCRGQEMQEGNYLIENVLVCWMLKDVQKSVVRDLSNLDLRNVSLAEYLKHHFEGTICLEGAKVSKRTFVIEQRHNKIIGMAFSHDSKTLAAISVNGYVSVTNVVTRSQMMVGRVPMNKGTRTSIGFSSLDELIVTNGDQKYAWRTVSYEKEESIGEEIQILQVEHAQSYDVNALMEMLKDDEMLGECSSVSENAQLIAIGHKNGLIQIWDVKKRACIADLILGDSQVITASFTKDGKIAAFCSGGRIVQIWNVHEQICTRTIHLPQRVRQVRFTNQEGMLECEFADGSYYELDLINGGLKEFPRTRRNTKTKQDLRKKLSNEKIQRIEMAANGNAIIMAEKSRKAWTWDQKLKKMSCCEGHGSVVKAVAICHSDPRFAASYSDERIPGEKRMRSELIGQKVVRVRIVKTGQCQWRLPTKNRTITALQFFTTNRIMLAAFSTNGDIMLWELINEQKWGREIGHWRPINVVSGYESEPLECAVSAEDDMFI
ncbi:MAG: WD40 repeat domain-containing protein, partial [Lachnospiraceae bacterium]|nr:WD40 repeat domain-containing protein [Lachnospiraceae bacterium]